MADDYSNNSTTTGVLSVGHSLSANFEASSDADWFKVALQAGTTYLFSMTGAAQGGGTLNSFNSVSMYLMSSGGGVYQSVYGSGSGIGLLQYTPSTSGDYYLQASTYSGLGTYTVAISLPAADDFAAGIATTGVFDANGVAKGAFQQLGDQDWFKFHADAGQHYAFSLVKDSGTTVSSGDVVIYDAAGKQVSSTATPFEPVAAGDYFVSVRGSDISAYTLTRSVLADDYSANDATPGMLATGSQLTGALQYAGDVDRFKITVEAGKFYTYQLTGNAADQQYLQLSLIDSSGYSLNVDSSRAADGALTLTFAPTQSGTYSMNLSGSSYYLPGGVTHGDYTLKSLPATTDDYGNTAATATTISVGGAISGTIQASSDIDAFSIALQAGVTYSYNLAQVNAPAGSSGSSLYLTLTPPGGYATSLSVDGSAAHSFTPTVSGTYTLAAGSYYSGGPYQYTLKTGLATDDAGASIGNAALLVVGTPFKGALETDGDRDWFGMALDAGTTYWFTLAGSKEGGGTLGSSSSYYGETVKLMDAKGTVLAQVTGDSYATAPVLAYVPTAKGTYYVEVSSPNRDTGTYTLQASIGTADDVGNDIAHAAAIAANTAVTGKLEVVLDKDVFKFSAEGGRTYAIELDSSAVTSSSGYGYGMSLALSDSSGYSVYTSGRDYSVAGKIYRLVDITKSGDYYLTVASASSGKAAAYTVSASVVADDYSANTLTSGLVTPAAPARGAINYADDHDWIKVHLDAGRTYVFDLQGSLSGGGSLDTSTGGAAMTLYTAAGNTLSPQAFGSAEPRIAYIATTTGDYFIDVHGNSTHMGSYTVTETLTSGDVTAPTLTSGPAATGAGLLGNVALGFSEAILLGGGVVLKDGAGAAVPLAAITSTGGSVPTALGSMLVIDPASRLAPGTTYTVELPDGSVMDLAGNHYAGPKTYTFTTQAAVTTGGDGNDYLAGKGNGVALVGGAGIDTAIYAGNRTSYDIKISDGQATIKAAGALAGDTLSGVERVLFDNTALALDIGGNGGQAYRLYQAAFNRAPDQAGVGYWISALDKGMSLHDVAASFAGSAEFAALYGAASTDAAFVNQVYTNVLHRAADSGGSAYWVGALHDGASRADVLTEFSESAENQAALIGVIGNGFAYTAYA